MTSSNAGRYECPWDYTPGGFLTGKGETHRFPAPVHLRIDRVREERAYAAEALAASHRRSARRIGAAAVAVIVLLVGLGAVYLTGIGSGTSTFAQLAALEAAVMLGVIAFVALLRRNGHAHDELSARARLYDVRLAELHQQAQLARARRAAPQHA